MSDTDVPYEKAAQALARALGWPTSWPIMSDSERTRLLYAARQTVKTFHRERKRARDGG